ncbi:zinc ABC transporter solute-binding protein [Caldanaerobacter subterraneus]|uniref:Zinc ABC transporter solute-binding protein n=2 Tax=Caldanaerobacter subterraneus TaxID=911092 RepID=A0A7Y2PMU5_9THEO|nr:zinc ABC transporter solute-binding protein [Caldanaerobacter subterraneus]
MNKMIREATKSMKKFLAILIAFTLILSLASCTAKPSETSKPLVYASFYPIYDLTSKIAGDKLTVKNIIPFNESPHGWEPSAKEMTEIAKAKAVIYLGMTMEDPWINKVKEAAPNTEFFEVSKGIEPIKKGNAINPHPWLSPKEALIIIKNIKDALVDIDPSNKDYFEKNYQNLKSEIENLDKQYREELSKTRLKTVVLFHSAFAYVARDYGLKQEPLVGMSAEAEPSPARISELVDLIKKEGIKYVFVEGMAPAKPMETIAKESGAQIMRISTIGTLSKEDMERNADFISLMKENLEKLKKGLE